MIKVGSLVKLHDYINYDHFSALDLTHTDFEHTWNRLFRVYSIWGDDGLGRYRGTLMTLEVVDREGLGPRTIDKLEGFTWKVCYFKEVG